MSIFWKYFRDTLAWPLIRSNGALAALAEGIAKNLDDTRTDILWLRNQFNPSTCEDQYVESHGHSRGVYKSGYESAEQFRARVVSAYQYQVKGSRTLGMPEVLALFGYTATEIENLAEEDPERWAEFRVLLEPPITGHTFDQWSYLAFLINDVKPARSVLAGVKIPDLENLNTYYFGGAMLFKPLITISEHAD